MCEHLLGFVDDDGVEGYQPVAVLQSLEAVQAEAEAGGGPRASQAPAELELAGEVEACARLTDQRPAVADEQDRRIVGEDTAQALCLARALGALVTLRKWSEMTWRQRIRWLRTTG